MFNCHSEIAQAKIVDAAKALYDTLGGTGIVVCLIVQNLDSPDPNKGTHIASNLGNVPNEIAYLASVLDVMKKGPVS